MSYAVTLDVFRENYLRVITEAFRCLSEAVQSLLTSDKRRAIAIRVKIEELLVVLNTVPDVSPFIEMKVTLNQLKDQLTDFIDSNGN